MATAAAHPATGLGHRERTAAARPLLAPPHALALLAGVLWVQTWSALPPFAVAVVAVGLASIGLALAPRWRLPLSVALGVALAAAHGARALEARWPAALDGADVAVTGTVVGIPMRDRTALRFELAPHSATVAGDPVPVGGRWRLAWYGRPVALRPGDTVSLAVRARVPRGLANPGTFDFERYAAERRITATGQVRRLLAHEPAARATVDAARARISRWIREERGPGTTTALLQALAVGDQAPVEEHAWWVLRATGTTHLVAISGFHIGLVGGFAALAAGLLLRAFPGLGLVRPRRQLQALAALVAAFGYSLLAGMSIPVQRTLVMIAVVLVAVLLRRSIGPWSALSLAMVAVLLIDPLAVLNPGFWLSFLGVAWLLHCLGARSREAWLASFGRAQAVAALGLLPVTLYFFQQGSVVGPLANLVAAPWISFVSVPLVLAASALSGAAPGPAAALLALADRVTALLWALLERMAAWPGSEWHLPEPDPLAVLLALAGAAILLLPRAVPGRALGALLLLPLLLPRVDRPPEGSFDARVVDVGQGLAVLVTTRRHALLVDTGAAHGRGSIAARVVVPTLRAAGVERLDGLIVTHLDNDHAGGVADVIAELSPGIVWRGGRAAFGTACAAGDAWRWDGVAFRILHPPRHFPELGNDSACVIQVGEGAGRLLIASDIGDAVEAMLIRREGEALRSAVLIVPHHGSRSSSSTAFIRRVQPELAVFTVGHRNRFSHPAPEVVRRYRLAGAMMLDSAASGQIRVRLDPTRGIVRVVEWRRQRPRWWQAPVEPASARG
jgi:competence protein ComEC